MISNCRNKAAMPPAPRCLALGVCGPKSRIPAWRGAGFALLAIAMAGHAFAGSVTLSVPITIQAPLNIVVTPPAPSIVCNALAGTVVAGLSATGGDGNTSTYSATGGDTADFGVSGSNIVVGANGIAAANCPAVGQTNVENLTVKADQP